MTTKGASKLACDLKLELKKTFRANVATDDNAPIARNNGSYGAVDEWNASPSLFLANLHRNAISPVGKASLRQLIQRPSVPHLALPSFLPSGLRSLLLPGHLP